MKKIISFLFVTLLCVSFSASLAAIKNGVQSRGPAPRPPTPHQVPRISDAIMINFDDLPQPCGFIETVALRSEYAPLGVVFSGPGPQDGGAILDECGSFGVSGHSSPNFLAFNCNAVLADLGIPTGPEVLTFDPPVSFVEVLVGSLSGATLTMEALDVNGNQVDVTSITLSQTMQAISVSAPSITSVVFVSQPCVWVMDDLAYEPGMLPCGSGDVVADGDVNSADAIRTLLIAAAILTPTPLEICAGDMNSDGQIDTGDAVLVLQKAVGVISTSAGAPLSQLDLQHGSRAGEVILLLENAAGLEVSFAFDPGLIRYLGVDVADGGGIAVCNDSSPGVLRLAVAKVNEGTAEVRLRFDVENPHTVLHVEGVTAFDGTGSSRLVDVSTTSFEFGATSVEEGFPTTPAVSWLGGSPNPFNPATQLTFRLEAPSDAVLRIYSAAGRRVREISMTGLATGEHQVLWDGTDGSGRLVSSGIYIVQVEANGTADTGRVVLVK